MENQHTLIKGYRDLSAEEIEVMNHVKGIGESLGAMIKELEQDATTDKRWVAIAKTHLQQGFMAAVRSIAKPTMF